ncbi:unnamed protein product [Protopolystoma xenopodis]|uniref:Uncharacterized protein n=1 Tax=Protopolystoma xenopodis TaxID=117903 RepID=A0A448WLZ6_9PLAT|nr:unnamed protein product [Protopolystoma xenopodis]
MTVLISVSSKSLPLSSGLIEIYPLNRTTFVDATQVNLSIIPDPGNLVHEHHWLVVKWAQVGHIISNLSLGKSGEANWQLISRNDWMAAVSEESGFADSGLNKSATAIIGRAGQPTYNPKYYFDLPGNNLIQNKVNSIDGDIRLARRLEFVDVGTRFQFWWRRVSTWPQKSDPSNLPVAMAYTLVREL